MKSKSIKVSIAAAAALAGFVSVAATQFTGSTPVTGAYSVLDAPSTAASALPDSAARGLAISGVAVDPTSARLAYSEGGWDFYVARGKDLLCILDVRADRPDGAGATCSTSDDAGHVWEAVGEDSAHVVVGLAPDGYDSARLASGKAAAQITNNVWHFSPGVVDGSAVVVSSSKTGATFTIGGLEHAAG